MKAEFHLVD